MRKFVYKVNLDILKITQELKESSSKNDQKDLFESIVHQGLTSRYPQGIGGKKARDYAKLLDKLDASKDGVLLLEDSQFDILKEVFMDEQSKFQPAQTRLIEQYRTNCENAEKVD